MHDGYGHDDVSTWAKDSQVSTRIRLTVQLAELGDHIDRTRASTGRPLSDRATAMRWDQRDDKKGSEIKEDRHIFRMPILPRRASEGTKRIEWSCDHVRV